MFKGDTYGYWTLFGFGRWLFCALYFVSGLTYAASYQCNSHPYHETGTTNHHGYFPNCEAGCPEAYPVCATYFSQHQDESMRTAIWYVCMNTGNINTWVGTYICRYRTDHCSLTGGYFNPHTGQCQPCPPPNALSDYSFLSESNDPNDYQGCPEQSQCELFPMSITEVGPSQYLWEWGYTGNQCDVPVDPCDDPHLPDHCDENGNGSGNGNGAGNGSGNGSGNGNGSGGGPGNGNGSSPGNGSGGAPGNGNGSGPGNGSGGIPGNGDGNGNGSGEPGTGPDPGYFGQLYGMDCDNYQEFLTHFERCEVGYLECSIVYYQMQQYCADQEYFRGDDGWLESAESDGHGVHDGDNELNQIPEDDVDISSHIELDAAGFGSASCPQPTPIQFMGSSFTIPYDFICDFASMIRAIVLTLAYFSAAVIVFTGLREI